MQISQETPFLRIAVVAMVLVAGCSRPAPPADNVIVLLVDTLRADRLGCYGYQRDTSPSLDALARDGIVFESAIAQSSWTSPSVASLFTSLYPSAHGVEHHASRLGPDHRTLAQEMQSAGRRSAAISTNMAFVIAEKGFDLGFDHFELAVRTALPGERNKRLLGMVPEEAALATDRAIRWVETNRAAPFFLYVHYFDPHSPYDAPPPYRNRFIDASAPAGAGSALFAKAGTIVGGEADVPLLGDLYDGEVAYVDSEIGRFIDFLRTQDLLDRSVVVVTSDHGEELFDHGGFSHGSTLFHELVHVPLVVRLPGARSAGRRVKDIVELIDVGPTVLELAGHPDTRKTEGRSLVALLDSGKFMAPVDGYSELSRSGVNAQAPIRHRRSLRTPEWNLLAREDGGSELYDARTDAREKTDLAPGREAVAEELLGRIEGIHARSRALAPSTKSDVAPSEEESERLKALGYLQ